VRGQIIQQGALKACCAAACDEDNKVGELLLTVFLCSRTSQLRLV
jgi:hypothetical protein